MGKKIYGPYKAVITAKVDFDFSPLELEEMLKGILKEYGDKHFSFKVKCLPLEPDAE